MKALQNVAIYVPDYTVSHLRRQQCQYSLARTFHFAVRAGLMATTVTNQNLVQVEMKKSFNSDSACYHSVQDLLSSRLLSKKVKN
jgi:hypothetical protein